jgi:Ca2+-binding EF-hand superfamily protein
LVAVCWLWWWGLAAAGSFAESSGELLRWMDRNQDGRIALAEYQEYLSRAFRAMDRDRDGIVALDEFPPEVVGPRSKPLSLERHHENLAAQFHRLDLDHDGLLDDVELAKPPAP